MNIQQGDYNPDLSNNAKETGGNLADIKTALDSLVSFSVPEHDQISLTYVGATEDIETVTYKLSSATVQTLTLTYDASSRIIDVTIT